MDTTKLKDSQLKSVVQFTIAYTNMFYPKLTKFESQRVIVFNQIMFYKNTFDEEFDLTKRELFYDYDGDGQFEDPEQEIQPSKVS